MLYFRVKLRISETIHDMVAFSKVSDSVFYMIERSSDPNLKEVFHLDYLLLLDDVTMSLTLLTSWNKTLLDLLISH